MNEQIQYQSEDDVKGLLGSLERAVFSAPGQVFLDNSIFPWPIDHLNKCNNIKRIDYQLLTKVNLFFDSFNNWIGKYRLPNDSNDIIIHLTPGISKEIRKSSGAFINQIDTNLRTYTGLSAQAKENLDNAGNVLNESKKVMDIFYRLVGEFKKEKPNISHNLLITNSLTDLLLEIKGHFKWGSKASEQDMNLVSSAFEKAILGEKDVYIITEDEHVELATEDLYNLIVCENTKVPTHLINRISPMRITVFKSEGDSAYHNKFCHDTVDNGKPYSIGALLRDHGARGTKDASKLFEASKEKIFKRTFKTIISLQKLFLPTAEEREAAKLDEVRRGIFTESTKPEEASFTKKLLETIIPKANLQDAFEIVKEHTRETYQTPEATDEKSRAISALEELSKYADKRLKPLVDKEINITKVTELNHELYKLDGEIIIIQRQKKQIEEEIEILEED